MSEAKILVIDDDPDFVEIQRTVLEGAGYQVISASNGSEGLRLLRTEHPDLLLLDVMMSTVTDGMDVSSQLRQDPLTSYLPIIMVTSIADTPYSGEVTTEDATYADTWLSKPVRPQRLLATVRRLLAQTHE